jgi:hypothetical protein
MKVSQEQTNLAARLGRAIIFFVLAIAVIAFLVAHVSAWQWATDPFLGMLLDPTLVLSTLQGRDWARLQFDPPLEQPDRLIAIDGQSVERYADVKAVLSERSVGDTVWVLVTRPDGELREEQITLTSFSLKDLFSVFIVPYLVGMAYLAIGIWVYWVQGWGRAGQAFTGVCVALALVLCGIFDISSTHRLPILWGAAVPFAAAAIMHLAMVFPQEPRLVRRFPVVRLFPYLPATFLALRSAFSVYDVSHPWAYARLSVDRACFGARSAAKPRYPPGSNAGFPAGRALAAGQRYGPTSALCCTSLRAAVRHLSSLCCLCHPALPADGSRPVSQPWPGLRCPDLSHRRSLLCPDQWVEPLFRGPGQ